MSVKKSALGKGLGALISDLPIEFVREGNVIEIDLKEIVINPDQPRKHFSQESLEELAASIKQHGIIQPIVVLQKQEGYYKIIVGERRFRAAKMLGFSSVPAIIRQFEQEQLLTLALLENLQREDLNPLETAVAYREIMDRLDLTQEELSRLVSKSRSSVANTLRLLKLPEDIQQDILEGRLTEGHGRTLLGLDDASLQKEFRSRILDEHLSVRETEEAVQQRKMEYSPRKTEKSAKTLTREGREYQDVADMLSKILVMKVKVKVQPSGNGKLEVYFSDAKEFEELQKILVPKGH